jgi:ATPase subunit of ABC transporter with duplicated ATPase domains
MIKVLTSSTQDTIRLGKLFSKNLKEKDVIVLSGVLGAGKTTFVKGILEGFRATSVAQSPSFTLVRRYRIKNLSRRDKTAAFRPRMEAWSGFLPARMGYRKPRGLLARGASYFCACGLKQTIIQA